MTTPLQHVRHTSGSRHGRRPLVIAALIAAMGLLLAPAVASAHAHLVQADPAPNGVVAHAPSVARFTFDEPLNPTLTRVRITDAAGRAVTTARGSLAPGHNHELWLLPLPALKDGTYSVFWTSESATDGHVISSFYTFRVAPSGGAAAIGAVTGAAAGTYGGGGGASSGSDLLPGGGVIATALLHALGLMAQALWLGALVVELFVLAPARRSAARSPAARLARIATPRLWRLCEGALVVTLLALAGEVISISLQGTSGDWAQALSPATLGGLLSSQNGHATLARFVVLLIAIALTAVARVPAFSETAATPLRQPRRARQALGIVATPPGSLSLPRWETTRLIAALLAALYMVLVALAGHASDVTPGLFSYPVDWLHLICTAAWAGGIAALAYGVMPARRALSHEARAAAVLPLLDRFSPIAYVSVAALALSGLYNAINHVAAPRMMVDTTYGILLIIKIVLVGLLILASASHVYGLRPRILRAQALERDNAAAAAVVHEGLATLAARLRLETWIGAGILLATALMSQTLPPSSAANAQSAAPVATTTPASISGAATTGDLSAQLTIAPPAVGTATFALTIREKGTAITGNTGAAIVHLYPIAQPDQRATLDPTATGTRFAARGSLPATGTWRADVLVRTATVNTYRTLPFTFTVGPGAGFLSAAQAAVKLKVTPGRIGVPNTVTIEGVQAAGVRIVSEALDMQMGSIPYTATKRGHGTWSVGNVYPLMNGRWALTVQVRKSAGGAWIPLRRFLYQVPATGAKMTLISSQAVSATAATSGSSRGARTVAPAAVSWAKLPYPAVVTFYNNGLVYVPGLKKLVRVGQQNHSVARAPDGTYWVTDYVGNDVAVLDGHSGAILARIPVGLSPAHMAFTPDGRRAYVSNMFSNDISVIDVHARRVITTIALQQNAIGPHGLAMSPDGSQVWVPCGTSGGMWVIDTRTNKVTRVVGTGGFPHAVTFSPDGKTAYMTDATQAPNSTLMVIDTATGNKKATVHIGTGSAMVVVSRDGRQIFVSGQSGDEVTVVDAATLRVVKRIPVGKAPHGMVLTPDGRYLYVAVNDADHVAVLDTRTDQVVATVPVPGGADELALVR